jgi:hypothetical protein
MALSFYEAGSDILVIRFAVSDDPNGEQRDWGTLMRDFGAGTPLSAELWCASAFLPDSLLAAVPNLSEAASERTDDLGYFDRKADIVWFRTGESDDIVGQELPWGLLDHDKKTDAVIGVELWQPQKYLPQDLLDAVPPPRPRRRPRATAAR